MAYNASKEEQVVTAEVEKNSRGEYIRVTKIMPTGKEGLPSVDIRLLYTNTVGVVAPTTKGVRINSEIIKDVVMGILEALDTEAFNEIMEKIDEKYGEPGEEE